MEYWIYFLKKHKFKLIGALLLLILWARSFMMIAPGYVGVIVNLFGERKGAEPKELNVGMHWIAPWKRLYKFPVFEQNHIWDRDKSFTFQTGEGLNVNADIGISYHLDSLFIYKLFCKYRRGLDEITDVFLRNYTRDCINKVASKMKIEELYGFQKEVFIEKAQEMLSKDLKEVGIIIDRIYLIGTLHFPTQVVNALNSKIEAIQRAEQRENELREAKAHAEKEIASATGLARSKILLAEAEAEANSLRSKSLTSELILYESVLKWDGKLPMYMGPMPMPFLNIDKK